MDYEEKLRLAKEAIKSGSYDRKTIEYIFPELKESEEEKIRKEIISALKFANHKGVYDKHITWLEKQGDTNETINRDEFAQGVLRGAAINLITWIDYNAAEGNACLSNMECKDIEDALVSGDWNKIYAYMKKKLEKQGQAFTKKDVDDAYIKGVCHAINELEKQDKSKFEQCIQEGDKIVTNEDGTHFNISQLERVVKKEPKFKVGNWYQCTKDFFGKGVTFDKNTAYYCAKEGCLQCEYGCHIAIVKDLYDNFKLWDISDAKDGDVLLSPSTPEGDKECPFIFKEIDKSGIVRFYVALLQSEKLKVDDGITNVMGYANAGYHIPATKEQRDLLFQKMKEAGYEWDADKKELKKIPSFCREHCKGYQETGKCFVDGECQAKREAEQTPAWSEEDENMLKSIIATCELAEQDRDSSPARHLFEMQSNWLKSLKERIKSQWKPSEEQMRTLRWWAEYGASEHIKTLYEELKKLMEE